MADLVTELGRAFCDWVSEKARPMGDEGTGQIRVTIPLDVFERIERTAAALGVTVNELGARCVVAGLDDAIESRITELERMLLALRGEVAPSGSGAGERYRVPIAQAGARGEGC